MSARSSSSPRPAELHGPARALVLAISLVLVTPDGSGWASARTAAPERARSGSPPSAGAFVVARGSRLLVDGQPFQFVGANLSVSHGPENRAALTEVLDGAAADGLRVGRVWAFGEGAADASPWLREHFLFRAGADDWLESAARHLDGVIAEAGRRKVRLIVTLANQWSDYGGVPRYLEWFAAAPTPTAAPTAAAASGPATALPTAFGATDRFYTDARARSAYRVHLERILRRTNTITGLPYRDDPTILAWELINESTVATEAGVRGRRAWIREMAALAHAIDPRHLVMSGVSGYRLGRERAEWLRICRLPEIDVCDGHLYPEEALRDRDDTAVDAAIDDFVQLAQFVAGKPFILGEVGIHGGPAGGAGQAEGAGPAKRHLQPWRGRSRADWLARVFGRLRLDDAAGGLVWIYQRRGGADRVHGIDVSEAGDTAEAGDAALQTIPSREPIAPAAAAGSVRSALRGAAAALVADDERRAAGLEPAGVGNPLLGVARGIEPILPLHAEVAGAAPTVARPAPWSGGARAVGREAAPAGEAWLWEPQAFLRADWEASGFYAGGTLAHVWGTETGFFEYAFEVPSPPAGTRPEPGASGEASGSDARLELTARLSSEYPGDTSPPGGASVFEVEIDGLRLGGGVAVRDDGEGALVTVRSARARLLHRFELPGRHVLRITVLPGPHAHGLCIYGARGAKSRPTVAPAEVELRLLRRGPEARRTVSARARAQP